MKRRTKLFSLILSLILVTVSVPLSAISEEIIDVQYDSSVAQTSDTLAEQLTTDIQSNLDVAFPNDELIYQNPTNEITSTVSPSDSQLITKIPDGIYAIQIYSINSYYISSWTNSSYVSCNSVPMSPTEMGMYSYLFMITQVSDTDRYIIRSASSPTVTLCPSDDVVVWAYISEDDSQVSEESTFNIIDNNGVYRIKHVGTGKYICGNTGYLIASDSPETQVLPNWELRGYRSYIEDGVYSFENLGNIGSWASTQNDTYEAGAYIQQESYDYCPIDSFSKGGMFKINRISNTDQYTIRPMTNNLLAWSFDGTNIVTDELPLNEADIPNSMRFHIAYDCGEYIIIPYGTTTIVNATQGVENLGTAFQISMPSTAKWKLYRYTGEPKHGIEILNSEDFITNGAMVGKTYNFNAVCWTTNVNFHTFFLALPSKCSDTATFNWNSSDYSGTLTVNSLCDIGLYIGLYGIKNGSTNIYITDSIDFRSILEEDVVYIQNKYSEKYATILGPSTDEGKIIHQYEYHEGTQIQWMIERDSYNPEYVLFKSLFSDKYMGVNPTNSNEIRQYSTIGDNTLWKIVELENGSYKIINKAYENSGRVLATPMNASGNGQWLTQRAYVDDGDYSDEWNIITQVISYVHYYDSSLVSKQGTINTIDVANDFSVLIYKKYFDITMNTYNEVMQYSSIADSCPIGIMLECTENDCGINCGEMHHKNIDRISDQLYYDIRKDDHIYVLWTDRGLASYCIDDTQLHTVVDKLAVVIDHRPVIHFMCILDDNTNMKLASMALTLVHETAHTFGMGEAYEISGHDVLDEAICVMEKFERSQISYEFYRDILFNNKNPFCDSCMEKMIEYTKNISIEGNQGDN